MEKIKVQLAKKSDDQVLNKILRDNEMQGNISIAFQRNPSYFNALRIEGEGNQVMVGRNEQNEIIGFGNRSTKKAYINGKIQNIGYLSNLRVIKGYKGKGYLHNGYNFLKKLHKDKKVYFYYSTIIEDNKAAIKILTSKKPYLPTYYDLGKYCAVAVSLFGNKKHFKSKLKIVKGSNNTIKKIINFLNKVGAEKQFYPYYKISNFTSKDKNLIDFDVRDFYVAMKNNEIVGVIGKWDQRKFRQIIITGYKGTMFLIKPIYNIISKLFKFSPLPEPNSQLNFFYVSFIAVYDNDPAIFKELIYALYNDFVDMGYSHFLVGLHSNDPLLEVFENFNRINLNSRLFAVFWEDGEKLFKQLDNRVPYVELATL